MEAELFLVEVPASRQVLNESIGNYSLKYFVDLIQQSNSACMLTDYVALRIFAV